MARTADELQDIARELNKVQTAGQTRMAIGAALKALHVAYPLVDRIESSTAASLRKELDSARMQLEKWIASIPSTTPASMDYRVTWSQKRNLVNRAYVVVAGVEGAADYKPQTSNWDILTDAIKDAPRVFGEGVGTIAGETAKGAGKVVGGLFAGMGFGGTIAVAIVIILVISYFHRGTIFGAVASKLRS